MKKDKPSVAWWRTAKTSAASPFVQKGVFTICVKRSVHVQVRMYIDGYSTL